MGATSIQWTDRSVNPIRARNIETGAVGHYCEKPSPGCKNCYASKWNERVRPSGKHLIGTGLVFDVRNREKVEMFLDESKLHEVLTRRKPTKFFWCDMTDLFGEWVPDEMIDRCFAVMALTPQHTHQVLTKRADRMLEYIGAPGLVGDINGRSWRIREAGHALNVRIGEDVNFALPIRNVWLGVSVEDQAHADLRIPVLLQTPAAVRFISAEPLLGSTNLAPWLFGECADCGTAAAACDGLRRAHQACCPDCRHRRLDWVIVGGESGPGARPFDLAWARSIVQQCQVAGVACFMKQLGSMPAMDEELWRTAALIGPAPLLSTRSTRREALDQRKVILSLRDKKGGDIEEFPADLRVREFPGAIG